MASGTSGCFCVGKREFGVGSCIACQKGASLAGSSSASEPPTAVSSSKRSRFDLVSEAEMNAMKKGYIRNTEKTTRWAVNNFLLWKQNRNVVSQEAAVPDDILDCTDPAVLSHWLSCFADQDYQWDTIQGRIEGGCTGCTCTPLGLGLHIAIFGQYLAMYIQEPSLRPATERQT